MFPIVEDHNFQHKKINAPNRRRSRFPAEEDQFSQLKKANVPNSIRPRYPTVEDQDLTKEKDQCSQQKKIKITYL